MGVFHLITPIIKNYELSFQISARSQMKLLYSVTNSLTQIQILSTFFRQNAGNLKEATPEFRSKVGLCFVRRYVVC